MHPLVNNFLLEQYAAGQTHGSFPAVGLFVDISGFSRMTDALMTHGDHSAEVLAGVMRAAFEPMIRSVYEHGGFISSQAGDAFTALFPLDNHQPGDIGWTQSYAHTLAAAWQIHQCNLSPMHTTPYGEFDIFNKVGLALGEVSWGIIDLTDQKRAVWYFQGSAVDGCSQAEHQASAGQVIVDGTFLAQVKDLVSVEPVDSHFQVTAYVGPMIDVWPTPLPSSNIDLASRFYPRELLADIHSGEFRQVVNLFIGLPTVRTEAQLAIFLQSVFELQNQYGGLLCRVDFGDKGTNLLLFWGAPVAHENDIERALDFILTLRPRQRCLST